MLQNLAEAILIIPIATLSKNFLQLVEDLQGSFPLLVLEILDFPCLLVLLIYTIHKDKRAKSRLITRPHFLEGELIQWVNKAKNVWIIVGQLLTKAGR